jgi:hypothetical protein
MSTSHQQFFAQIRNKKFIRPWIKHEVTRIVTPTTYVVKPVEERHRAQEADVSSPRQSTQSLQRRRRTRREHASAGSARKRAGGHGAREATERGRE